MYIYYNSFSGEDYIGCSCSRWDVDNYSVIIETWLKEEDLQTLLSEITPGAVSELYTILGQPLYYDKTWSGDNTIMIYPNPDYHKSTLRKMRRSVLIYPKTITTSPIKTKNGWIGIKIEGYISGSTL